MCSRYMCNNSNNRDPYIRSTVYTSIHGSDNVVMSSIGAVQLTIKKYMVNKYLISIGNN